uniref:Uncharacterized protein n=1 Tax=Solanum lycopersicum TaxID=4081 RepID=A0A3Q7I6X1_SOLLC
MVIVRGNTSRFHPYEIEARLVISFYLNRELENDVDDDDDDDDDGAKVAPAA